jgi:hypothetical protein
MKVQGYGKKLVKLPLQLGWKLQGRGRSPGGVGGGDREVFSYLDYVAGSVNKSLGEGLFTYSLFT